MAKLIPQEERQTLYRYETTLTREGVLIIRNEFEAVFETPCFYFVVQRYGDRNPWTWEQMEKEFQQSGKVPKTIAWNPVRKIRKDAYKTYCYADNQRAFDAFKIRQDWRVWRLSKQMAQAELALKYIADHGNAAAAAPSGPVNLGHTEFTQDLNWNEY